MPLRICIVDSHPIQYHVPWYRELARRCDLSVLYTHAQSPEGQARAGYGVAFDWDVDLASGYRSRFLTNVARDPGLHHFAGCDSPELRGVVARERFDAVITTGWYLKAFWQAAAACKLAGTPVLVRGDSQLAAQPSAWRQAAKRLAYPLLLRAFDGFLSVGQRNREYLERFGIDRRRIFDVPHAIDLPRFTARAQESATRRDVLRAALGASGADRIALFVGRLVPFKRPCDVLEALAALPDRGNSWVAAFVGAGPLAYEVEQRAAALGVRARMLGFRNQAELPELYGTADVLVLSSDGRETWGLVANEAMACGLPVLVSDAAGCAPDLIVPGRTGYAFPCADTRALAACLARARDLRADERTQAALREKAHAHGPDVAAEATLRAVEALRRAKGRAR